MSKAEYERKWRLTTRQSRRVDTLTSDYIRTKYPTIHAEIMSFYETLNSKYTTKDNLTKTIEYRQWKTQQRMARTTEQGTNSTTTTTQSGQGASSTTPEPEQGTNSTTPATTTTIQSGQGTSSTTPEPEQGTNSTTTTIQSGQGTSSTTEPQYDLGLDPMDLNNLIEELNKDDEIRALMNGPFNFELSDDQYDW